MKEYICPIMSAGKDLWVYCKSQDCAAHEESTENQVQFILDNTLPEKTVWRCTYLSSPWRPVQEDKEDEA